MSPAQDLRPRNDRVRATWRAGTADRRAAWPRLRMPSSPNPHRPERPALTGAPGVGQTRRPINVGYRETPILFPLRIVGSACHSKMDGRFHVRELSVAVF